MKLLGWVSRTLFDAVHGHSLVFNTCWEDPALDRLAMDLGPEDNVLVITSAGCNALDYALAGPRRVWAVDVNPRQNALLELKTAAVRELEFEPFFAMFGHGRLNDVERIYRSRLRRHLSPASRWFWDRHIDYFVGSRLRPTFYYHGATGAFARLVNLYVDHVAKAREAITELLEADTLEQQARIYRDRVRNAVMTPFVRKMLTRDATLALIGAPRAQREQLERQYPGGVPAYVLDCLEGVFTRLHMKDNSFWRVYMTGGYTRECCPEYLKEDNYRRLKDGLVDRVSVETDTVLGFLRRHHERVSRFVLLDHMDWLSTFRRPALEQEWQAIVDSAAPNARVLWRSAALNVDFVDPIEVDVDGRRRRLGDLLVYHRELAASLHARDRVHTYGSFSIADLAAA